MCLVLACSALSTLVTYGFSTVRLHAETSRLSLLCDCLVPLCTGHSSTADSELIACVLIVQVIETLSRSSHIEPWAARAAGLVFAQYFWFRHCFLLTTQQGEAVQQLVVSMLSDKKLEVQDLAAASLSGGLIPMLLHVTIIIHSHLQCRYHSIVDSGSHLATRLLNCKCISWIMVIWLKLLLE